MKPAYHAARLHSERLILRSLSHHDLPQIHRIRSDPETAALLGINPAVDLSATATYIQSLLNGMDQGLWLCWSLTLPLSDFCLGSLVLWNFRSSHNDAEIGYSLIPEARGQGYMYEALGCLLEYAFSVLALSAVNAFTSVHNSASLRLLRRLGFIFQSETMEDNLKGEPMLLAHYSLTKEGFYAR